MTHKPHFGIFRSVFYKFTVKKFIITKAFIILKQNIRLTKYNTLTYLCVTDLQKAFDTVKFKDILRALHHNLY